jgi:hypothetical protein
MGLVSDRQNGEGILSWFCLLVADCAYLPILEIWKEEQDCTGIYEIGFEQADKSP